MVGPDSPTPPASLLSLPRDVLLHCVFSDSSSPQGRLSARLCRQTCRTLRRLLPKPASASKEEGLPILAARLGQGELALKLVTLTCAADRLPITREAQELAHAACSGGCLDVIQFLVSRRLWDMLNNSYAWQSRVAEAGHMHILKWTIAHGRRLLPSAVAHLASQGSVELMEWLEAMLISQMPPDALTEAADIRMAYFGAARSGSLELVRWFQERGPAWRVEWADSSDWCAMAAGHGHVHLLQWALSRGARMGDGVARSAALANQKATLQWLQLQGVRLSASVAEAALLGGHFQLLHWLHEQGCPLDMRCGIRAASSGNLQVLQWVMDAGCLHDLNNRQVTAAAAGSGDFAKLRYVVERGFFLGPSTASAAIRRGDLPMLRWLREQDCPWNASEICSDAVYSGRLEVLQWCHAQGGELGAEVLLMAVRSGPLPMMQWLREQGCPWISSLYHEAARNGRLTALRWLKAEGCPWPRAGFTSSYSAIEEWAAPFVA
jgi:hypothetical protein